MQISHEWTLDERIQLVRRLADIGCKLSHTLAIQFSIDHFHRYETMRLIFAQSVEFLESNRAQIAEEFSSLKIGKHAAQEADVQF